MHTIEAIDADSSKTMIHKRLLCTQAAIQFENTINNPNIFKKWRIKQVTKANFSEVLTEVKTDIYNSDFIAISMQKTGSYSSPWQKVLNFDTPEIAYLKAKRSAEKFQLLQFAICPFTLQGSNLTAYPYNFHLFPRDELKTGMPSYSFACQTSYLTSMARLGFDFNSCIYDGISYLSKAQEATVKHVTGNQMIRARAVKSPLPLSVADSIFIERIKIRVRTWISACKDSKGSHDDPLVIALRKVVLGDHGSRPCMDIDVCSERQVQLVLEVLKVFSDDIVSLIIPTKHGSTQGVRIVMPRSKEDKTLFEKELQDQEEEQSKRVRGFREVVDVISASQKPVVSLNSLDEFTSVHSKFISPLPQNFEEFKTSMGSVFPSVIDVGHLMKELKPNGSMNNVPAPSSLLRSRFSEPIIMNIPLRGTPNEMCEGKIHGHNVLRLSHRFAKMFSVVKQNQQHVSDNEMYRLERCVNIFGPCSTLLGNSDDDEQVSSGSMKRLSCDDLVFIWGFRSGLSGGELKRLLSGCHEAFSGEFDVRLVDKSTAVVALQQPSLKEAFLNSVSSGGDEHDGLKEMISEGIKAADYETYKRILDMGIWETDLADCLDQVAMSNDQIPIDSHGRSPYVIWWDDDTVLDLDEE